MNVSDKAVFESAYAGQAPWDIGRPQQALVDAANQVAGSILDAGCGTGDNALYFAGRGCQVTGIDFLSEPIDRARRKAASRDLPATFLVLDALELENVPELFDKY
jgi:2-polyprenyl-3-methyl-5-hydroxy-6-metoxy-1,4-benzoquinol methylase